MEDLRRIMELDSLWTLWFWITHVAAWSITSHFTLGVPFDMVVQANREKNENGPWTLHCDAMIRASVFRIVTVFSRFGLAIVAIWSFILGSVLTFAVWYDNEFALALLTLFVPLTAIYTLSALRAFKMDRADLTPEDRRKALRGLRFWIQIIGILAIFGAAAAAIYTYIKDVVPFA